MDKDIKNLMGHLKGLGETSNAVLNKVVTPEIEAQLPPDVKSVINKGRNSFHLDGLTPREKQQELSMLQNELTGIMRNYGLNNNR